MFDGLVLLRGVGSRKRRNADLWEGTLGEDSVERSVSQRKALQQGSIAIKARVVEAYMRRQVFPQAPSPTMTSLRRISAIL